MGKKIKVWYYKYRDWGRDYTERMYFQTLEEAEIGYAAAKLYGYHATMMGLYTQQIYQKDLIKVLYYGKVEDAYRMGVM